MDSDTPVIAHFPPAMVVCHREPIRRTLLTHPAPDPVIDDLNIQQMANLAVPTVLNEGTANLAPWKILNQSISDNLHAICCRVPREYTNFAGYPHKNILK